MMPVADVNSISKVLLLKRLLPEAVS